MSIIEVEGLSFGYSSEREVIRNVSFRIEEPSFVCIVGPNGVGKSTLIRCMNGLVSPTEGRVRIFGRDVSDYSPKELARTMSYVPVMTSDFNVLTVLDTVLIGRYAHQRWRTTDEDIEVAYKALEAMEIGDLSMRNFNELSAGQHQKVSLARGLVQEPRVLILDEPTSNLDVRHQMYVSAFLRLLVRKTGMTVIMVSHDLNLSSKFADKIIVMSPPGILYGMGEPKDVITERMIEDVYKVECDIVDDHGVPHVMLQSVVPDG